MKDGKFLRDPSLRETTKRWIAQDFSVNREGADWVTEPKAAIKKDNLTFTVKFLWLIFRHYLSPTAADNIVTWDRAVLMVAMIAGFEVALLGFYRRSCTRGLLRSQLLTLSRA